MLKAAGNSELLTFTDSDFASCEETRKSRSGACIFFCNSLNYCKSGEKYHVSRSTTEAEFYALLEGITEVEFLEDVIHFAYKVDKRIFNCKNTEIFCDNSSAGKIVSSIESIARTKHIEVAHLWIQHEVAKERIKVHNANTENQAADIFTKSLALPLFEKFKKRLGLICTLNNPHSWIAFLCMAHIQNRMLSETKHDLALKTLFPICANQELEMWTHNLFTSIPYPVRMPVPYACMVLRFLLHSK